MKTSNYDVGLLELKLKFFKYDQRNNLAVNIPGVNVDAININPVSSPGVIVDAVNMDTINIPGVLIDAINMDPVNILACYERLTSLIFIVVTCIYVTLYISNIL